MDWNVDIPHLTDQIASLGPLIVIITIVAGVALEGMAVVKFARMKSGQTAGGDRPWGATVMLFVGAALVSTPIWLNIGSGSIGATTSAADDARFGVLTGEGIDMASAGSVPGGGTAGWNAGAAMNFAATVVGIVGFVGFVRGWLQLNHLAKGSGGQGQSFGHAMTLIWGGLAAINLPWTIDLIARSMGITFWGFGVT